MSLVICADRSSARLALADQLPLNASLIFANSGSQLRLPANHFRSKSRSDGVGEDRMSKSAEELTLGCARYTFCASGANSGRRASLSRQSGGLLEFDDGGAVL